MKTKILFILTLTLALFTANAQNQLDGTKTTNVLSSTDYLRVARPNGRGGFNDALVPVPIMPGQVSTANTNPIRTEIFGFTQGMANDGPTNYLFQTGKIATGNNTFYNQFDVYNNFPTTNLVGFTYAQTHLGDGDCWNGRLYVPLVSLVNQPFGTAQEGIGVYSAHGTAHIPLGLPMLNYFEMSNTIPDASACCVAPSFNGNPTLFVASFYNSAQTNRISQWTIVNYTNFSFVRWLPIDTDVTLIQGLEFYQDRLVATCESGTNGVAWSINPYTGQCSQIATVSVPGEVEWEGTMVQDGLLAWAESNTGLIEYYNFFNKPAVDSAGNFVLPATVPNITPTKVWAAPWASTRTNAFAFADIYNSGSFGLWNSNGISSTNSFYISVNSNSVIKTYHLLFQP